MSSMSNLIIAEHDKGSLNAVTLNTVSAAQKLGGEIHLLVAGQGCATVAEAAAKISGVAKVWLTEAPYYAEQTAENIAARVVALAHATNYSHILAPATTTGKNLLPRVAALLDVAQISEIVGIESPDTFVRPIYAGNLLATVQSLDAVKVITVRATAFAPAEMGGSAAIEHLPALPDLNQTTVISRVLTQSSRPELSKARVVVAGGRGLGSTAQFHALLEPLADSLGAAIGATRAAVDAGYTSNDCQIGQTGQIVAPQLYFAIGISGAFQHLAGMRESRVIVAINRDAEAAIFQVADYGLVGDLFDLVPELTTALAHS